MNILTDPLPSSIQIGGTDWRIRTGHSVGIRFELLMQDQNAPDEEKVRRALALYYPELPPDREAAVEALLWFYRCGDTLQPEQQGAQSARAYKKAYCFEQDADLFYSAFYTHYGIDLAEADLHWWKFRALMLGLPSDCELKRIMAFRTADTKDMSKAQKRHFEKMRKLYALRNPRTAEGAMNLAERDRRMKDYVKRRFEEVGGQH